MTRGLRTVALIKQIPRFEEMRLGRDGRLVRTGTALEINPYCRRALAKAIDLARGTAGRSVAVSLGPPPAVEALREALAAGADEAVLVADPAFAGSDTLATARALTAVLRSLAPFDVVLCGLASVDADTGQVGPQVAEMLGLPFAAGVRSLVIDDNLVKAGCERDDGWRELALSLPAVLSVAERLCPPAKATLEACRLVADERVQRVGAAALGEGPWGQAGSPTQVGQVKVLESSREHRQIEGSPETVCRELVEVLAIRRAFDDDDACRRAVVACRSATSVTTPVGVVLEPGAGRLARELLGRAAELAAERSLRVVALAFEETDPNVVSGWGADAVVAGPLTELEEVAARTVAAWAVGAKPWCILGPSTTWGREVMARAASRLSAGLVGDAVDLERRGSALVCWKPAFGGQVVAAITSTSPVQMVTVRAGTLPLLAPRPSRTVPAEGVEVREPANLPRILEQNRHAEPLSLLEAPRVVGVGLGVAPDDYPLVDRLRSVLGAELAATRKVTDRSWLPRGRQVGITGLNIAPRLYIALGVGGSFNHMVGVRRAQTVVAVNSDPAAPIFEQVDFGLVGDWRDLVPCLIAEIEGLGCRQGETDGFEGAVRSSRARRRGGRA